MTISGITGIVSIDANGDRNADYSLLDMNTSTGEFEVFRRVSPNKLKLVGHTCKVISQTM